MPNGTHTCNKARLLALHIYLTDAWGETAWMWRARDRSGKARDYCLAMDKARNTIEAK